MMLLSRTENYPALRKAGLVCLYAEVYLAWMLAIDGLIGIYYILRRPHQGSERPVIPD